MFVLADAQGLELRLQLLVASDLAASLAEQLSEREAEAAESLAQQVLAQQVEALQAEPQQAEAPRSVAAVEIPTTPEAFQPVPTEPVNLDLVLDVELKVTLRFGQRQLTLREVLELTSGSVIELDRQVEEPVELLLDGRVIARGEAVVIDGNYGLRVTEVPQQFTPTMLR
jgi:flagellar motor switch protein FliN/FliY